MMRLSLWTGAALAVSVALAGPPAEAQTRRFDGLWSVMFVTQAGACDQAYRYPVLVEYGRLRYGGPEAFNIAGRVRPSGVVSASISRGRDRAEITGRLTGEFGRGTWVTSGSRRCSGYWTAERRS